MRIINLFDVNEIIAITLLPEVVEANHDDQSEDDEENLQQEWCGHDACDHAKPFAEDAGNKPPHDVERGDDEDEQAEDAKADEELAATWADMFIGFIFGRMFHVERLHQTQGIPNEDRG